jgi:hypothetical protein
MVASTDARTLSFDVLLDPRQEALAARLARVAYEVALKHPHDHPFTELELNLWQEIRGVFHGTLVDDPEVT